MHFYDDRQPQSRRIKRLVIEADRMLAFLLALDGKTRFEQKGLPADARVVGVRLQDRHDIPLNRHICLYIESADFEEVQDGRVTSEIQLSFTQHFDRTPLNPWLNDVVAT